MGIRYMCKEREDNLIDINVYGHGCMEGLYKCEGRFNTKHVFSDGFNPDNGWYRIADYRVNDLKIFKKKGINITYDDNCKYVKNLLKMKILIVYSYILHTYFRIKMGLKILLDFVVYLIGRTAQSNR